MTNREIAKRLNISPASLSIILNHKSGVSKETRVRVIQELEEMGLGDLLKKDIKDTPGKNISFVVYKKKQSILGDNASYVFLIEGMQKAVYEKGCNLFFNILNENDDLEERIKSLNDMDSIGMILYATEMNNADIDLFSKYNKPMIIMDNDMAGLNLNCIYINHTLAGYQAISYLIKMGHRRIGYLRCSKRLRCFQLRQKGYEEALEAFSMSFEPKDIWDVDLPEKDGERKIKQYIETSDSLPTAFVSDEDYIAAEAVKVFQEYGIKVPDEVSVIGYNDSPIAVRSDPMLTTIQGLSMDYLRCIVDEFLKLSDNKKKGKKLGYKIILATELVERNSVKNIN